MKNTDEQVLKKENEPAFRKGDYVQCVTSSAFPEVAPGAMGDILRVRDVSEGRLLFEEFPSLAYSDAVRFRHLPTAPPLAPSPTPLSLVAPAANATVGMRFDDGKPRMDLLDPIALEGCAQVLAFGAKKYAAHNWQKGMGWSKVIGSLLRHILRLMAGEDIDSESGLPHVDHIHCNSMFLANYYRKHKDKDDRYKAV